MTMQAFLPALREILPSRTTIDRRAREFSPSGARRDLDGGRFETLRLYV